MKKLLLLAGMISTALQLSAQGWSVHVGSGLSYSRLMPAEASTPSNRLFKYAFSRAGMYFSPELHFIANAHNEFGFGYQYSNNYIGLKFPGNDADDYVYDIYNQHNFSVGYHYGRYIFHEAVLIKGFVKMGLAYGNAVGYGSGSSSGGGGASQTYISYIKLQSDPFLTEGFWSPTSTIGFAVGPNLKDRGLGDRLTLQVSATLNWKSPIRGYTKYEYMGFEDHVQTWGIIQYKGLPLLAQIGLDYRLFKFDKQ